jgi:NADH:ubiquinone oxidoreductase subunit 4 (subunit M)
MLSNLLPTLILLPLVGSLVISFMPASSERAIKVGGLVISSLTFILSLFAWIFFDPSTTKFQFVYDAPWLGTSNIHLILGIDGISLFFVILTTFLIPICLLAGWKSIEKQKEYVIAFLVLEALTLSVSVF